MATKRVVARETAEQSGIQILRMVKQRGGVAGARKRIIEAMPELAELMLEKAKEGSVAHLKLALELGGVEKRPLKSPATPLYSQRVERQLINELDEIFPPVTDT